MNKIISILCISFVFTGELEVEGNLNVTGDINSPTIDALSGMKPERIYSHIHPGSNYSFTVPDSVFWYIEVFHQAYFGQDSQIYIDGEPYWTANWRNSSAGQVQISNPKLYLFPGNTISSSPTSSAKYILTIFEYPISASGTDQGMDYVEP